MSMFDTENSRFDLNGLKATLPCIFQAVTHWVLKLLLFLGFFLKNEMIKNSFEVGINFYV